jgi:hypothetical protein
MSKVIVGIERKVGEVAVESCGRTLSVSCKTEGLMGEAKASVASRRKIMVLICDIVGVVWRVFGVGAGRLSGFCSCCFDAKSMSRSRCRESVVAEAAVLLVVDA